MDIAKLEKEKDHLDKVINAVKDGRGQFRLPYQAKAGTISSHLKEIAHNIDKLSEQVR